MPFHGSVCRKHPPPRTTNSSNQLSFIHSRPCYLQSQWPWQGLAAPPSPEAVWALFACRSLYTRHSPFEEGETMTRAAACGLLAGRLPAREAAAGAGQGLPPCTCEPSEAAAAHPEATGGRTRIQGTWSRPPDWLPLPASQPPWPRFPPAV